MAYQPIEDYGIIGNMLTTALVGKDGSIDFFCYPSFDSPCVFAGILDSGKGGHFRISPTRDGMSTKQYYWPETNVLVTRFLCTGGVGQIVDFMPAGMPTEDPTRSWLVRQVHVVRGSMQMRMECQPAFDYARQPHETKVGPGGAAFHSRDLSLGLSVAARGHGVDHLGA